MSLLVISTHPIQYQAPIYRLLQQDFDIPTTVIYGSDFSLVGYQDREFGHNFAWDTNLLDGYESIFLSSVKNGGSASDHGVSASGLEKHIKHVSPKVILLLGYRLRFDLRAFHIVRKMNYPMLFRAETTDHAQKRSYVKTMVRDHFLRWFYGHFDKLLYIGKNSLKHYQRLGCLDTKLEFSPYGVDTSVFELSCTQGEILRKTLRSSLGISDDRIVLIFSGKLVPRKGPDLLIQAVKQLPVELRRKTVLLFLGDGELRPDLEKMVVELPDVPAHFVGFQNQRHLTSFYHAADLLVMPSRINETWGLVVNEALHHGVPCVVSNNVGCTPDLIEPGITGEIFEGNSVISLVGALQRAYKLISKSEVKLNCQRSISSYSLEAAAKGIAEAYKACYK